jgi:hypothetical protein
MSSFVDQHFHTEDDSKKEEKRSGFTYLLSRKWLARQ